MSVSVYHLASGGPLLKREINYINWTECARQQHDMSQVLSDVYFWKVIRQFRTEDADSYYFMAKQWHWYSGTLIILKLTIELQGFESDEVWLDYCCFHLHVHMPFCCPLCFFMGQIYHRGVSWTWKYFMLNYNSSVVYKKETQGNKSCQATQRDAEILTLKPNKNRKSIYLVIFFWVLKMFVMLSITCTLT